jgi:hypothetical protein
VHTRRYSALRRRWRNSDGAARLEAGAQWPAAQQMTEWKRGGRAARDRAEEGGAHRRMPSNRRGADAGERWVRSRTRRDGEAGGAQQQGVKVTAGLEDGEAGPRATRNKWRRRSSLRRRRWPVQGRAG